MPSSSQAFALVAYILLRCGVLAHQHHRQSGSHAGGPELGDLDPELLSDLLGDLGTVDDLGDHGRTVRE